MNDSSDTGTLSKMETVHDVEVFPIRQQIVRCEYCFNRYKCKMAHHAVRWCNGYVGPWNIKSLKKRKK